MKKLVIVFCMLWTSVSAQEFASTAQVVSWEVGDQKSQESQNHDVKIIHTGTSIIFETPTAVEIDKITSSEVLKADEMSVIYKACVEGGFYIITFVDEKISAVIWIPDIGPVVSYLKGGA